MNEWIIKNRAYKQPIQQADDEYKTIQQIYTEILSMCPLCPYPTDKGTVHSYIDFYSSLLEPYRHGLINLLEIGIEYGWSLALWRKYFENGNIYGIDIRNVLEFDEGVHTSFFDATNEENVKKFYTDVYFDIIIDDANHDVKSQISSFKLFFPKLKNKGIYIIEDVQDIDKDKQLFLNLRENARIIDLRNIKNRYDDILVIYEK